MIWTIVKRHFVTQRHIIIPFILSSSTIFAIEYILLSLTTNTYIQQHHQLLGVFAIIGNVFMSLLAIIFIIYANQFVLKQQQKTYSLYIILGMEKRHLSIIILIESIVKYCIIALLSIVGGYLFGALLFMFIRKVTTGREGYLSAYPFDFKAMWITLLLLSIVMILLLMINVFKITMQLMNKKAYRNYRFQKVFNYSLLIIGMLCVGNGYRIALQNNTPAESILALFVAIFFVFIGTYLLFISLSVLLIERLQKLSKFYYRPKRFFLISGLRARMKSNAVGLASIAILCTFLIVTLGMTVTTYRSMGENVRNMWKNQYLTSIEGDFHQDKKVAQKVKAVTEDIKQNIHSDTPKIYTQSMFNVLLDNRSDYRRLLKPSDSPNEFNIDPWSTKNVFITIMTLNDYNQFNRPLHLKSNEIGVNTSMQMLDLNDSLVLRGKSFNIKPVEETNVNSIRFSENINLIVKNDKERDQIIQYYTKNSSKADDQVTHTMIEFNAYDLKGKDTPDIHKLEQKHHINITSYESFIKMFYNFNGGLIFVGSLVSFVLVIGIFLIIYYKQVSEAQEDVDHYVTMAHLGLDNDDIKHILDQQLIWLFSVPFIVSIFHTVVASKIIYNVLGLFGEVSKGIFITSFISVIIMVSVLYLLTYKMTSYLYSKYVNQLKK
ncbi:FtsX-like permease family protein [Staphylococcus warneri]|uniref:FtsX-like permease family protein n=1 Tax=Staphylococcus warneri TaxID=1292 RepID=UPI001E47EF45|nr:FtsX-like permease family protein [Staphylococcus warneri]